MYESREFATLPAGFWEDFVEKCWEKQALVISKSPGLPVITPEETFDALIAASGQYREGVPVPALDFYIEHARVIADVKDFLPVPKDGSIAGYAERLSSQLAGRRFCLVAQGLHVYHAPVWLRIRDFLAGLFGKIGIPGDRTSTALFLGNYEKTPFGLHPGDANSFKLVIAGKKRIRTWPDEFFEDKQQFFASCRYDSARSGSLALDGEPGDVLYWPSTYWHIGESVDDGVVASLSIVIFTTPHPLLDLDQEIGSVQKRLEESERPVYPAQSADLQRTAGELNSAIQKSIKELRKTLRPARLQRSFQIQWLNRLSGLGFAEVPPPLPSVTLSGEERLCADSRYPILYAPAGKGEFICSANGHSFSVTEHPSIVKLLADLNRGKSFLAEHLMRQYSGTEIVNGQEVEVLPDDIRLILEKLVALRALTRVGSSNP